MKNYTKKTVPLAIEWNKISLSFKVSTKVLKMLILKKVQLKLKKY